MAFNWRFHFCFQAEGDIQDGRVTGVQTCALPIYHASRLAVVWTDNVRQNLHEERTSYPNFEDWRKLNTRSEERRVGKKDRSGLSSANSRKNTKEQEYAQNKMLAYQKKEPTANVTA